MSLKRFSSRTETPNGSESAAHFTRPPSPQLRSSARAWERARGNRTDALERAQEIRERTLKPIHTETKSALKRPCGRGRDASVLVGGSRRDYTKAAQVAAPLCSAACSLLSTTGPSVFLQPITSNLLLIPISCSRMVAPAESGGMVPNTRALITPDRL